MDTVCPKLYSCSPHAPMAERMEALGILRVAMERERARRLRSVCVVALQDLSEPFPLVIMSNVERRRIRGIPIRIPNHEKRYIFFIRIS